MQELSSITAVPPLASLQEASEQRSAVQQLSTSEIIQRRVESKTRRFFTKHAKQQPGQPSHQSQRVLMHAPAHKNELHDVAGHFFFPLLLRYDRKIATCDLMVRCNTLHVFRWVMDGRAQTRTCWRAWHTRWPPSCTAAGTRPASLT